MRVFKSPSFAALLLLSTLSQSTAFTSHTLRIGTSFDSSKLPPASFLKPPTRQSSIDHFPSYAWFDRSAFVKKRRSETVLRESYKDDDHFDIKTSFSLVGGQGLLVGVAVVIAYLTGTPNLGFGPEISFDAESLKNGFLLAAPLGIFGFLLDTVEERFPALKDVTRATQRSVLALMGGTLKPGFAIAASIALGLAAGFGEEMLFRGILQYQLSERMGTGLAVGLSSVIFGALHAVTPLYAILASVASVYFGGLYLVTNNLAVPIACHAIYDVFALLFAHWTITQMSESERREIAMWEGPTSRSSNK